MKHVEADKHPKLHPCTHSDSGEPTSRWKLQRVDKHHKRQPCAHSNSREPTSLIKTSGEPMSTTKSSLYASRFRGAEDPGEPMRTSREPPSTLNVIPVLIPTQGSRQAQLQQDAGETNADTGQQTSLTARPSGTTSWQQPHDNKTLPNSWLTCRVLSQT